MARSSLINPEETKKIRLPDAISYSEAGILSRTVLAADGMRVVLFAFAAGQELTEHKSPSRALVVALAGRACFRLGDREVELQAGDLLHFPPNAAHSVVASEPFSMLLILQRGTGTNP